MSDTNNDSEWHKSWGLPETTAGCSNCDWLYLVPPAKMPLQCPHCGQAELAPMIETAADKDQLPYIRPPEKVLPFAVSRDGLSANITKFAERIPFAPSDLKSATLLARLQPVYLPMWLVDSKVKAFWQAETGFNYQVVSHRESYGNGRWQTQEVEETRIRWEPRVGELERKYDNVPIPALKEHQTLLNRLGNFHMEAAVKYHPKSLGEALVRLPNRSPKAAWPAAVPQLQKLAQKDCAQATAADHIRDYHWSATYPQQNWTLLLLPLYTTYYHDDEDKAHVVLMNGQRGGISGQRRASMKHAQSTSLKIALAAAVIAAISLFIGVVGIFLPVLLVVAAIGFLLGLLVGTATIYPIFTVWRFNRKQDEKKR